MIFLWFSGPSLNIYGCLRSYVTDKRGSKKCQVWPIAEVQIGRTSFCGTFLKTSIKCLPKSPSGIDFRHECWTLFHLNQRLRTSLNIYIYIYTCIFIYRNFTVRDAPSQRLYRNSFWNQGFWEPVAFQGFVWCNLSPFYPLQPIS